MLVTPSYHIYPNNQPSKVNILREATMIWFDLLSHVKEVEPMETHHTNINYQLQDPKESIQYFRQLALGPIDILDNLRLIHSHAIGMSTTNNSKSLS